MDFNKLVIRLSDCRLLDLGEGKVIVNRLNEVCEDEYFKLENSGHQMREIYNAQSIVVRRLIDTCKIIDDDKVDELLEDIERAVIHFNELSTRNDQVIETNLKMIVYIVLILSIFTVMTYRTYTSTITNGHKMNVDGLIESVFSILYEKTVETNTEGQ